MVATLKVDTITEASNTGTANLSLDSSGNVTIGNNLTVNGTTTQTGNVSFTGSAAVGGNVTVGGATFSPSTPASGSVAITGTLAMGSSFLRNRLINGNMSVWQRGTSFTNTANSYQYTADRWGCFSGTSLPAVISQVSSGLTDFQYALRVQRPNGNTSTSNTTASQVIETINCYDLAGKTVTLSFWARAGSNYSTAANALGAWIQTGTGTDQGLNSVINSLWTGQATNSQSVTLTTSFQRFSLSYAIPAGTNEINVAFITYPTGTAGANDYFDITGVQLEEGAVATPFERELYNQTLAKCQRYYEKSYNVDVAPGTASGAVFAEFYVTAGLGSYQMPGAYYRVTKRATPTVTVYSSTTGAAGYVYAVLAAADKAVNQEGNNANLFNIYPTLSASDLVRFQWTATAEL